MTPVKSPPIITSSRNSGLSHMLEMGPMSTALRKSITGSYVLLSPCGRGRGPSRGDGKVRGLVPRLAAPSPSRPSAGPLPLPQGERAIRGAAPLSPARGEGLIALPLMRPSQIGVHQAPLRPLGGRGCVPSRSDGTWVRWARATGEVLDAERHLTLPLLRAERG